MRAAKAASAAAMSGPIVIGRSEEDRKVKFFTRDGCEVERKWKKGEYEEKVKCKPDRYGYRD